MRNLIILGLILFSNFIFAQTDSLGFNSFDRYYQVNGGISYGNLIGNIAKYTNQGGSLDMTFADGIKNHIYGINMNILMANKLKEFSMQQGFEHYNNPATILLGLFYGRILGNLHKSHFQSTIGLNYGWLFYKKQNKSVSGYNGFVPQIEISRSIKIGKTKYSEYQYTSQYTPMQYDPSISQSFIDIFIDYKHLLLNNNEGRGGLITIGIRYKLNKYSINKNVGN